MFIPVLLAPFAAYAQEPVGSMDDAGVASVSVVLPQSEAEVRAALADPEVAALLPPEVLAVRTLSSGRCVTLGVTVKGAWDPLQYTTQRCPTADGFRYKLLQSDSITAYSAEWSLAPHVGGGTEVTYRVSTEVDLPVPRALVRKNVLVSARDTVLALVRQLTSRRH